jgi:putative tryptophan/tyrosine transport system substrate-binding protein
VKRNEFILLALGAVVAVPFAARAQQKAMPVIGYLNAGSPDPSAQSLTGFRQGLGETGYVEGQNVAIQYRWAEGRYDRLPALAADLVDRHVDVITTTGGPSVLAAKNATLTIPIVFRSGADPVELGLVASFARPGGNLTGVSFISIELMPKRLELLSELVPHAGLIALLVNPNSSIAQRIIGDMQGATSAKGLQLDVLKASTESEIDAAFETLVEQHAGALVVGGDTFFANRLDQIMALAAHHAVPAIYELREAVVAGGLISYGPSRSGSWHQVGTYVGKILKGAKPADLPVQRPTTYELVINLKTARAIGLTVPQSLLTRADEVIE